MYADLIEFRRRTIEINCHENSFQMNKSEQQEIWIDSYENNLF